MEKQGLKTQYLTFMFLVFFMFLCYVSFFCHVLFVSLSRDTRQC